MEQEGINNSTDKDISDSESSSTDTPINISTKILAVTNSDNSDDVSFEKQETLLSSARNGNINLARQLLQASAEENITLDVNCKGTSKHNLGWTPLQLASYFGHYQMVELLLQNGASINMVNRDGDTALHKAAFIGRSDLVLILLQNNADVNIINGEGQTAKDVAKTSDISEMISAAELAEVKNKENQLLDAAKEGDVFMLNKLLKEEKPPNINCTDAQGNSCLHCASYRGHKETAVLLLQNGIDTTIKNNRGQTALDLARDAQMHQVLNVRPIRQLQKTVARFEGQLLKLSRFLGWKLVWVVLERGVLTYFNSRADASSGVKRKDFKYLDGARVTPLESDSSSFIIHFSDATLHKLSIVSDGQVPGQITRQKWINALNEHAEFSSHYLGVGAGIDNTDDDEIRETGELGETAVKPLGSMQDTLQTAAAHLSLLETQVQESVALVEALDQLCPATGGLPASAVMRFQHVCKTAEDMVGALTHCLSVVRQQEEIREARLRVERDKCRVLEEALMLLARQHHALELSVSASASAIDLHNVPSRHSRYFDAPTPDDEFYDAFEADSETDTLVTAMAPISPSSDTDTLVGIPSPTSSCTTLLSSGGHAYHCARDYSQHNKIAKNLRQSLPVPMFSRNDFSIWSVLKNCIGKELSKITMPVIFNEPLSFLQRMVEYMEYAELLRKASEQSDPISRIQYVAAFAVSALASNWERLGKPFNPLLGETYELEREEFRIICEQVSHHPPVSAFHSDSKDWIFHGSIHPKLKFWGKSVEIQPKGTVTVELPKWGEAYTWSNVNCCVHNIIVGRLWMEQYGTMEVINHKTGHRAVLTFKPAGWNSKDLHRVDGFITDKSKNKLFYLYGKWTEFIKCTDVCSYEEYVKENAHKFKRDGEGRSKSPNDSPSHTPRKVLAKLNSLKVGPFKSNSVQENVDEPTIPEPLDGEVPKSDSTYSIDIPNSVALWQARPRPPNSSDFYQFTTFAMSLNEMEAGMDKALCPTDSRLRPDIRKLEQGDIDGAAVEKTRLEEKQRDARKSRRGKKGEEWAPRWFCQGSNPYTKQDDWLYSGGYWDRNYSEDPEIF